MIRLDRLIAELCPDGVEYRTLGEIATEMYRGSGIKREQITENGIPCVRYGEIYTTYNIWFDKCVSHTDENEIVSRKYFEHGDVLFAITGESVEEIAKSCVYVGFEKCLAGGDIVVMKHTQEPKYMAYVLSTAAAQEQKSKGRIKSKVVHSNVPALKAIAVPVPPLPVQREIVRILDNFTELTAELAARKRQYNYYRDDLLTFADDVPMVALGDLCSIVVGQAPTTDEVDEYAFVNAGTSPSGYLSAYNTEPDIITTPSRGQGGIGHVGYQPERFWCGPLCYRIRSTDKRMLTRFLYYFMSNNSAKIIDMANMTGVPALNRKELIKFSVPIVSLEKQERIVSILNRFDTLVNNITSGLPAEIEARRKQYEYYRDKLLEFLGGGIDARSNKSRTA